MASEETICKFETAIQKSRWNVVGFANPKREEEALIKRKNCNYFYCFGIRDIEE